MVNNTANWRANAQRAHELVQAGELGEIRHVTCSMGSPLASLFEDPNAGGWVRFTLRACQAHIACMSRQQAGNEQSPARRLSQPARLA